jgi:vitamin-K-epoxide reductase (warfarin-sensitive)
MINFKLVTKSALLTAYSIFNILCIFILSYLLTLHYQADGNCVAQLFGDCGVISKSAYSAFFGIPIALLGILWFGAGLVVALIKLRFVSSRLLTIALVVMSLWSVGYALYLVFVEAFIIEQWCQYCLLTDVFILLSFICVICLFFVEKIEIDAAQAKLENLPK